MNTKEYNRNYYRKNKEAIKAHEREKYANKTEEQKMKRQDETKQYYDQHRDQYRNYEHKNPIGTGGLGMHRDEDFKIEAAKIKREMKRLGLRKWVYNILHTGTL